MDLLAQVSLNSDTGLVEDKYVNTFALSTVPAPTEAELAAITADIFGFYVTQAPGALAPMSQYLSPVINNTAGLGITVALYNITGHLDGSPHGSPIRVQSSTVPASGNAAAALPSECAAVITLEASGRAVAAVEIPDGADPGGAVDRPKQRRTGRIYFGPLNTNALEISNNVARVANQFRDTARLAVAELQSQLETEATVLGVWSRTDGVIRALEAVSVDDAFDTVRSRGEKPSLRERTLL